MDDIVRNARDDMIEQLYKLEPGSTEIVNQAQVVKTLSEIDINDRKLEFEMDKEETRKMEKSNERVYLEIDWKLRAIEMGIRLIDTIIDPMSLLKRTKMNNDTRIFRDEMGYTFERDGIIATKTLNNAQKDRYD